MKKERDWWRRFSNVHHVFSYSLLCDHFFFVHQLFSVNHSVTQRERGREWMGKKEREIIHCPRNWEKNEWQFILELINISILLWKKFCSDSSPLWKKVLFCIFFFRKFWFFVVEKSSFLNHRVKHSLPWVVSLKGFHFLLFYFLFCSRFLLPYKSRSNPFSLFSLSLFLFHFSIPGFLNPFPERGVCPRPDKDHFSSSFQRKDTHERGRKREREREEWKEVKGHHLTVTEADPDFFSWNFLHSFLKIVSFSSFLKMVSSSSPSIAVDCFVTMDRCLGMGNISRHNTFPSIFTLRFLVLSPSFFFLLSHQPSCSFIPENENSCKTKRAIPE